MFNKFILKMGVLLLFMLLLGCGGNSEDFYSYSKDLDLNRFPLIKPYQITSADRGETWSFIFRGDNLCKKTCYISNIDSVSICKHLILVHTQGTIHFSGKEGWVIIDTKNNLKNFSEDKNLLSTLKEYGVHSYKSYDFLEVCKQFQKSLVLPPEWRNQKK